MEPHSSVRLTTQRLINLHTKTEFSSLTSHLSSSLCCARLNLMNITLLRRHVINIHSQSKMFCIWYWFSLQHGHICKSGDRKSSVNIEGMAFVAIIRASDFLIQDIRDASERNIYKVMAALRINTVFIGSHRQDKISWDLLHCAWFNLW